MLSSNILIVETLNNGTTEKEKNAIPSDHKNDYENIIKSQNMEKTKIKNKLPDMNKFFTKNQGQLENDEIFFTYSTQDKTFGFSESSILIKLFKKTDDDNIKSSTIKLTFENSNKVTPIGINELTHKNNYFTGSDKSKWTSNVLNYERIVYENLYNGIDLIYYFSENGLKYDWIIKANSNASKIIETYDGISLLEIETDGALIINSNFGILREENPFSYQNVNGVINEIETSYQIIEKNKIKYNLGEYDSSKELIIDPLIGSTFIGGEIGETANDIAVDNEDNIYLTGLTYSDDFPTTPGCYDRKVEKTEVFVSKFNKDLTRLEYSSVLGGVYQDTAFGITVDEEGNAYVVGSTRSSDFPTTEGAYNRSAPDLYYNGFVLKLSPDGSDLLYSTFTPGCWGSDIVLDSENNVYITGPATNELPVTSGCYDDTHNGFSDSFVCVLNAEGSDLLYATYLGGSDFDQGNGIAIDQDNNVYITGVTLSEDFPTTPGCYDNKSDGENISSPSFKYEIFISKLNANCSELIYSTYIGGNLSDQAYAIAIDSDLNVIITGITQSLDYPVTDGCYDDSPGLRGDMIITKLNHNGTDLVFSTYFGGDDPKWENGNDVVVDSSGNIYITGETNSEEFPTTPGCFQDVFMGGGGGHGMGDCFVVVMDPNGQLSYSTYIGGAGEDFSEAIALDSNNNVCIAGWFRLHPQDYPVVPGCYDVTPEMNDAFCTKLWLNDKPIINMNSISPNFVNESETVHFIGNGTDDGTVEGYEWISSIGGFLSDKSTFITSNLSNGTHMISFRIIDNNQTWSNSIDKELIVNGIPIASIKEIDPINSNESEFVRFIGNYTDHENDISEYYWESNISGFLSNSKVFYKTNLSKGIHKITFRVKDNFGVWSENVTKNIIVNGIPKAIIKNEYPKFINEFETIQFFGIASDDGKIITYEWNSSLDGFLSKEITFSISNLSNGTHRITFRVLDDSGVWSEEDKLTLIVNGLPIGRIYAIRPDIANEGELVRFYGTCIDFENDILEYLWESDVDGILSNEEDFTSTNLSNGTHKITFNFKDSFDIWSEIVSESIALNGNPRAKIDNYPKNVYEGYPTNFYGNHTDFENNVLKYNWESNINGFLSDQSDFSTSTLSNGTHEITLKVQDNYEVWSETVSVNVTVNGKPRVSVESINPNPAYNDEEIFFSGNFFDHENNITDFYWKSDIDGLLSKNLDFSISDLSTGIHTITFYAIDNYGYSSDSVSMKLDIIEKNEKIQIKEIIIPYNASENQIIILKANIINLGDDPISKFNVNFYYDDIMIESKYYENVLDINENITIFIEWKAVVGTHIIKVQIESKDGEILNNRILENKIVVEKENKKDDTQIELFVLFTFFIILLGLLFTVNSWYGKLEKRKKKDSLIEVKDTDK